MAKPENPLDLSMGSVNNECVLCSVIKEKYKGRTVDTSHGCCKIFIEDDNFILSVYEEYDMGKMELKIDFCPYCGKRLKKGDNDEY